jgi:hypothetical protein
MSTPRRHVFISHRFVDDDSVGRLTQMLSRGGWDVRNSSIRVKEANQRRIDSGQVADRTLERVLRRKITWAQTVIVVVGNSTHASRWVQYEIEQAHRQGKAIVGVYARGCTDAQLPEALERYATSIVSWNTDSIMKAVDGGAPTFETPDGDMRPPQSEIRRHTC